MRGIEKGDMDELIWRQRRAILDEWLDFSDNRGIVVHCADSNSLPSRGIFLFDTIDSEGSGDE
jgi:hypothetical protein